MFLSSNQEYCLDFGALIWDFVSVRRFYVAAGALFFSKGLNGDIVN